MMDPVYVPTLSVSFELDLDVEYDPFSGRTQEELAEALQDDIHDILYAELSQTKGIFSNIVSIKVISND